MIDFIHNYDMLMPMFLMAACTQYLFIVWYMRKLKEPLAARFRWYFVAAAWACLYYSLVGFTGGDMVCGTHAAIAAAPFTATLFAIVIYLRKSNKNEK